MPNCHTGSLIKFPDRLSNLVCCQIARQSVKSVRAEYSRAQCLRNIGLPSETEATGISWHGMFRTLEALKRVFGVLSKAGIA